MAKCRMNVNTKQQGAEMFQETREYGGKDNAQQNTQRLQQCWIYLWKAVILY